MKKERFEAITDAVLAIIITLMVLEIKLPELSQENLNIILQQIAIYAVSFTMIAILWLNHHHIFEKAQKIDLNVVWLNFAMLFATSLIPMATAKLDENFHHVENHVFYALILGMVCLFYACIQHFMSKTIEYKNFAQISLLNWGSVALYFLAVPLSFVSIYISAAIFVLFVVLYFLLTQKGMN